MRSHHSSYWTQTPPQSESARVFVCGVSGFVSGWSLSHRCHSRTASLLCGAWSDSLGLKLVWNSSHTQDSQTSHLSGFSRVPSSGRTGWSSCRTRSSGRASLLCAWADVCSWPPSGRSSSHSPDRKTVSLLCELYSDLWVALSGWTVSHTGCSGTVSLQSEFACGSEAQTSCGSLFHRGHSSKSSLVCWYLTLPALAVLEGILFHCLQHARDLFQTLWKCKYEELKQAIWNHQKQLTKS